ncbi:UNVERIFIED_CONTAM: Ubiquitin-conjugating enzyme E2 T [Trichonephila clavipes]
MQSALRLKKELERFSNEPNNGISCWQDEDLQHLKATIVGPDSSPYENGVFHIDIQIPEKYPFLPPNVHFITPVYHPNIDDSGRICLEILKLPPQDQNGAGSSKKHCEETPDLPFPKKKKL